MNQHNDTAKDLEELRGWLAFLDYLHEVIEGIPGNLAGVFESLQDVDEKEMPKLTGVTEALIEEKVLPAFFDLADVVNMITGHYTKKLTRNGVLPLPPQPQASYQHHTPPHGTPAYPNNYPYSPQ